MQENLPSIPEKTSPHLKISLKLVVLGLLLLTLAGGAGYKWYEWQTITAFARMHNQAIEAELGLIHEINSLAQEMRPDESEDPSQEEPSDEEIKKLFESGGTELQEQFDEGKTEFAFFSEKSNEYETLLRDHQQQYNSFVDQRSKFVYGPKSQQMRDIAAAMNQYYDTELADLEHNRVAAQLFFSLSEVRKDMFLLQLFTYNTRGFLDESATSENFNDIAALEKYGRDDFAFEKEAKIKEYNPYGYESLQKFRNYFKTSYSAIKDVVSGNLESAGYKFSRLGQETADLGTIDDERLTDEGKEQGIERKRKLVEALLTRYELVQKLAAGNQSQLPIIGDSKDWDQELLACHAYVYKADLYQAVRDKYPSAQSPQDFVAEMNQVSPKTTIIDDSDQYQHMTINNGDKEIVFTCKSADGGAEYQLTYQKEQPKADEQSADKQDTTDKK